ncbi:MAG: DUF5320 domain-containing protein [Erysipelotrichaceae bacterium]|nr:DUF5320 domain-containing protein [Erysipelotrichaceae bacterium]
MPARDGSGPMSQGPRTGRQMGNCAPNDNQGMNRPGSYNQRRGQGGYSCCGYPRRQRFFNRGFASSQGNDFQKEALEQEAADLEGRLNAVKAQLNLFESDED